MLAPTKKTEKTRNKNAVPMTLAFLEHTGHLIFHGYYTAESDLIATEMLAFPLKSSRNNNDSYQMIANPSMGGQLLYKVYWASFL